MKRLLLVLAFLAWTGTVHADNIVVLLDTSQSMETTMRVGKTRMEVAHAALIDVLSKVPPSTNVGVLTFGGWVYELGPVDQARLQQAVLAAKPNGGTPLWAYIKTGANKLLEARQSNNNLGVYKLVVVTDVEAQDGDLAEDQRNGKLGYLNDIKNRGLIIDAIGLDMKGDHKLATQVNGSYMRGDDPASLKAAVQQSVAEIKLSDAGSQDLLAEINGLPDEFSRGVLVGLGVFQNQGIGEDPPKLQFDESGQLKQTQVGGATTEKQADGGGLHPGMWGLIGVAALVLVIIAIALGRS